MKSLDEHNADRSRRDAERRRTNPPNGVACPRCGHELVDTTDGGLKTMLAALPPRVATHCPAPGCGWSGLRQV